MIIAHTKCVFVNGYNVSLMTVGEMKVKYVFNFLHAFLKTILNH